MKILPVSLVSSAIFEGYLAPSMALQESLFGRFRHWPERNMRTVPGRGKAVAFRSNVVVCYKESVSQHATIDHSRHDHPGFLGPGIALGMHR